MFAYLCMIYKKFEMFVGGRTEREDNMFVCLSPYNLLVSQTVHAL